MLAIRLFKSSSPEEDDSDLALFLDFFFGMAEDILLELAPDSLWLSLLVLLRLLCFLVPLLLLLLCLLVLLLLLLLCLLTLIDLLYLAI